MPQGVIHARAMRALPLSKEATWRMRSSGYENHRRDLVSPGRLAKSQAVVTNRSRERNRPPSKRLRGRMNPNGNPAVTQEESQAAPPTVGTPSRTAFHRPVPPGTVGPRPRARWRILSRIRMRLLLSYVVLLAVSTAISLVAVRQVLHLGLDEEINNQLLQESAEFRSLMGGNDPSTGRPFGTDLKSIFDVFFERNFP